MVGGMWTGFRISAAEEDLCVWRVGQEVEVCWWETAE